MLILFVMESSEKEKFVQEPTSQMVDYLKANGRHLSDISYQLDGNYANVYLLQDSTVVLLPNGPFDSNYPAFLFSKVDYMNEMIKNDYFPIPDINKTFLEKEADRIKMISTSYNYYFDFFVKKTNSSINNLDENALKGGYELLINGRKKYGKDFPKLVLSYSIILCEYLKSKEQGEWSNIKRYGKYNPYYLPAIKIKNKIYRVFEKVSSVFDDSKSPSFDFLISIIYRF